MGATRPVWIESPSIAPGDTASAAPAPPVWTRTLRHVGASFVKAHLARLHLGPADRLRLLDGRGRVIAEYVGPRRSGRAFWAPLALGDTIVVELRRDAGDDRDRGVAIDRYGYGETGLVLSSPCGGDQTEDVACHAGTAVAQASAAVGLIVFEEDGVLVACTGFLVSPMDHLLTAGHCVPDGAALDSLEVRFGYQAETCGGPTLGPFESYAADRVHALRASLDVGLLTLRGHPSGRYGYLRLSGRDLVPDEPLYLPQHPNGGPKKVSVSGCAVSAASLGPSDFGHSCDTAPGSSGSPVLDLDDEVVGMHHLGGCTATSGQNQALLMRAVLGVIPPQETTLALARARLEPRVGRLSVKGVLRPSLASGGIAPMTEAVSVTVADGVGTFYSATVLPGSFRHAGKGFMFSDPDGTAASGMRRIRLNPRADGSWGVSATIRPVWPSTTESHQVTVTLRIGGETAAVTVPLRRGPRALVFP